MDTITISSDLANQLGDLHSSVELRDPNGRKVGRFVPILDLTGWEPVTPDITDEERQRRKASTEPRMTTAELLASLESRHVSNRVDADRS